VFDLKELGSAKSILFRSAGGGRVSSSLSNQVAYCIFFRSTGGVRVVLRRLNQHSLCRGMSNGLPKSNFWVTFQSETRAPPSIRGSQAESPSYIIRWVIHTHWIITLQFGDG
jgi:hypothetical protein